MPAANKTESGVKGAAVCPELISVSGNGAPASENSCSSLFWVFPKEDCAIMLCTSFCRRRSLSFRCFFSFGFVYSTRISTSNPHRSQIIFSKICTISSDFCLAITESSKLSISFFSSGKSICAIFKTLYSKRL